MDKNMDTTTSKKMMIGGILLVILVILLIAKTGVFNKGHGPSSSEPTATTTLATTTGQTRGGDLGTLEKQGKVTVGQAPTAPPPPSLDRAIPPATNLDPAIKARIVANLSATVSALRKDPTSFDNWISLGISRKQLGDYEGAAEAWQYAGVLSPKNIVSFGNLGDLYENFIKDYAKAEQNMLVVVHNDPHLIAGYRNLYDLYTLYMNRKSDAENVLKIGLKYNPGNSDLLALQAKLAS